MKERDLANKNMDNYSENFTVSLVEIDKSKIINNIQTATTLGSGDIDKKNGLQCMYLFYIIILYS
jgi:hypothetical protein